MCRWARPKATYSFSRALFALVKCVNDDSSSWNIFFTSINQTLARLLPRMMKIIIAKRILCVSKSFPVDGTLVVKWEERKQNCFQDFPYSRCIRAQVTGERSEAESKRVARRSRHLFSTFLSLPSINYLRHTASCPLSRSAAPHRPARSSLRPRSALVRCVRAREPSSGIERGEILCPCWRAFVFYCSSWVYGTFIFGFVCYFISFRAFVCFFLLFFLFLSCADIV